MHFFFFFFFFSVYITWMYLVVMYIVPFTCLAVFNLRIYLQIRKANAARAQLSRLQQREIRMATMLMIVVIVFFMCNVLALVINLLEVRGGGGGGIRQDKGRNKVQFSGLQKTKSDHLAALSGRNVNMF